MLYKVALGVKKSMEKYGAASYVSTVVKYIIADDIVHAIQEAAHLCNVSVGHVWSAEGITDTVETARPREGEC